MKSQLTERVDLVQYLFTLPRLIDVADRTWELVLYPNHPGYDFRLCYKQFFENEVVPQGWRHRLAIQQPVGYGSLKISRMKKTFT